MTEDRPGLGNGVWLSIATSLLEHLGDSEWESNESWLPLNDFIEDMGERHQISGDDVRWVINLISTPTRLSVVRRDDEGAVSGVGATKATALVERPRYQNADKARLSRSGRTALKLAKSANGLLYSESDARKIITALTLGDFGTAIDQTAALTQEVRGLSQDLVRLLEQPSSEETWKEYVISKDAYINAIKSVHGVMEEALRMFAIDSQAEEAFDAWADAAGGNEITASGFRSRLRDAVRTVHDLGDLMQQMISELLSGRREVVGNVDFRKAAVRMVMSPPTESDLEGCLLALGPWETLAAAPHAEDLVGLVQPKVDPESIPPMVFEEVSAPAPPTVLTRFLQSHGREIRDRLAAGQPVSISQAIADGMIDVNGESALSELVGVYVYPDWISDGEQMLRVCFRRNELSLRLPDGRELFGDELILEALPAGATK